MNPSPGTDERTMLRDYQRAFNEYGGQLDLLDIADVEEYIFARTAPQSAFVRAVIEDSLYDAVGKAPVAMSVDRIFLFSRFVRAAVPVEAQGRDGYARWTGQNKPRLFRILRRREAW